MNKPPKPPLIPTVSPSSLAARTLYKAFSLIIAGIFIGWNRLSVKGKENIPYGACIWAPVHRSYIDTPIHAVLPVRMRFMGKESMWKYGWFGWFCSSLGGFPVSRGAADRDALHTALDVLVNGNEPLVAFPEGGRRDGPRVHLLQHGAVYLAAKAQVPIVPVGIGGTAAVLPRGAKFLYPRRIRIVIGEPIIPPKLGANGRVSRKAVESATHDLRERIQALYDEAQAYVGTPNEYSLAPAESND